jgi:hypothetical protein
MDATAAERLGERLVEKSGKTPGELWVTRLFDTITDEGSDEA